MQNQSSSFHRPPPTSALSVPVVPSKIRALPEEVVDRIAAGEVVQRPASVAKELIENSLDADSTIIDIQAQSGGLRSLTVSDDGYGIRPSDLLLAATRFATSKLVRFDDLKSIRTFGFRGEALASASMVGRLSIVSRRRQRLQQKQQRENNKQMTSGDDKGEDDDEDKEYSTSCAYKLSYRDSIPVTPKPRPAAGKEGTTVKLEDLFYNLPSRRRAFAGTKKESEEYNRILAVAQRYAVQNASRGVAFVCRKKGGGGGVAGGFGSGSGSSDLNTLSIPSVKRLQEQRRKRVIVSNKSEIPEDRHSLELLEKNGQQATRDVIGHIFGSAVARELLVMQSGEGDVEAVSLAALKSMQQEQEGAGGTEKDEKDNLGSETSQCDEAKMEMLHEDRGAGQIDRDDASKNEDEGNLSKYAFAYRAKGLVTNSSYAAPKSSAAFILFINDRLVECPSLKRAIEGVYADTLPKGAKPFVYLSLELPGPHVDVNVHPTKREVAFLHEDRLCDALATATRQVLGSATASRIFYTQALLPTGADDEEIVPISTNEVALAKERSGRKRRSNSMDGSSMSGESAPVVKSRQTRQKTLSKTTEDEIDIEYQEEEPRYDEGSTKSASSRKSPPPSKSRSNSSRPPTPSFSSKKAYDPTRFVRTSTSAPTGALEPFLVQTQSQSQISETGATSSSSSQRQFSTSMSTIQHFETCELFSSSSSQTIDMSVPGAFASICRCQIERGDTLPPLSQNPSNAPVVRPKKVTPTECDNEFILSLRNEVASCNHRELGSKLRLSTYVGSISRRRSLLQCGIELLMVNHYELAKELFYQLALTRFGEVPMATLGGGGVNVKVAIEQALQFEEEISSTAASHESKLCALTLEVSETNSALAEQAVSCLADRVKPLRDFFSIRLEMLEDPERDGEGKVLMLTGLPILLEGHSPPPHGLPVFLLRLATEVDWNDDDMCFKNICKELAAYYAEIPFAEDEGMQPEGRATGNLELIDPVAERHVKHTLFPALSFLLVPPKKFASDGTVVKLALLSSLYKVFERC